jgi:hypothetical protein
MKRFSIFGFAVLMAAVSFAAWPFGNIGLDVDDPKAQLDVGGDAVFHGRIFILPANRLGYDEDYSIYFDRISEEFPENTTGIFMYSGYANDAILGFYMDPDNDGESILRLPNAVFDTWDTTIRLFRNYAGERIDTQIGKTVEKKNSCGSTSTSIDINFYENFDEHWIFLDNGNTTEQPGFKGATLNFTKSALLGKNLQLQNFLLPMHVFVQTYQPNNYGTLVMKVNGKPWFTAAANGSDMLFEFVWTPPFKTELCGRWSLHRAVSMKDNTALPVKSSALNANNNEVGIYFNVESKFRISDDGNSI